MLIRQHQRPIGIARKQPALALEQKPTDSLTLGEDRFFEKAGTAALITACGTVTGIGAAMLSGDQGMGTLMVLGGTAIGGIAGLTISGSL